MRDFVHIVSLDAPSPPDYGGSIDIHYKVKALAAIGKKIILHYFDYNKKRNAAGLDSACAEIYTYSRKLFFQTNFLTKPYIIQSRTNEKLVARLNEDEFPILLEGLHCAGIVPFLKKKQRVVLRMHNEEPAYYNHLAQSEKRLLKKIYFKTESRLLYRFQTELDKQIKLACLSRSDAETFSSRGFTNVHFIPCFIPWQEILIKNGRGNYCLYHGNLAVSENIEAAQWLIENVFSKIDVPFVIAGKGTSKSLIEKAGRFKNVSVISNPLIEQIAELIENAHINIVPSMNETGVKLKLLHALFRGRHCITNSDGIKGSDAGAGVHIANRAEEFLRKIKTLMDKDFENEEIAERNYLATVYNNKTNAEKLNALW